MKPNYLKTPVAEKTLGAQLLHLAIAANNTILRGSFSGDDIHTASELCKLCEELVEELTGKQDD